MLKIVVFDGGFGGELFADCLEETLPVVEVIRVIDWRHAEALLVKARLARQTAEAALRPYLGNVDLIFFANHLLSLTSLKYFRRKYPEQRFLGFELELPPQPIGHRYLILTTHAVAKTLAYRNFLRQLKTVTKTLWLDAWPAKIDDGELTAADIASVLQTQAIARQDRWELILACAQFNDIKAELADYFGGNLKIYDSFDEALRRVCRVLKLRGGVGRKKS